MAEWSTANLSFEALAPILAALDALGDGVDTFAPLFEAAATATEIIGQLQRGVDVSAEIVDQAFEAVITALNELVADSAGHLLFIPPIAPLDRAPASPRIPLRSIENLAFTRIVKQVSASLVADGGNYGVYRKFVESLFDEGDFSRPDYSPDAYMGGAILFFGADSFASILQGMLTLSSLFDGALSLPVDNYQLPVPQNIKARPVATAKRSALNGFQVVTSAITGDTPQDTEGFIPLLSAPQLPEFVSVKVSWDAPRTVQFQANYTPAVIKVKSWHVFVKAHERIEAGEDLSQYEVASFTILPDGENLAALEEIGSNPVTGAVNGVVIQKARPTTTYYISAAYTLEIEDLRRIETVDIGPTWETLSGQVRFRGEDQLPYTQFTEGTPPDWRAIASPVYLIPPVQQIVREVTAVLELYRSVFADRFDALSDSAAALRDILEDLQEIRANLNGLIANFLATLESVDIGVWSATFSGQGGTPFLVNAVGELLLDPATVNRPTFDTGDEAVSAIVLVVGSETPAEVERFLDLIEPFLGADVSSGFAVLSDLERSAGPNVVRSPLDSGANPTTPENAVNLSEPEPAPIEELGVGDDDDC